jgi:hypothetical protein
VEEIQDVLTDLMFIDRGRIVLECSMEEFDSRYLEVMVNPEHLDAARALKPIYERPVFGRSVMLFEHVDRDQVAALGEVRRPSIADLFVAVMGKESTPGSAAPATTAVIGSGSTESRPTDARGIPRSEIRNRQSEVEGTK